VFDGDGVSSAGALVHVGAFVDDNAVTSC
jgi:hypothetical protein